MADETKAGDCGCNEATIGGLLGVLAYGSALWQGLLPWGADPFLAILAGVGALIAAGLVGKSIGLALARRRRRLGSTEQGAGGMAPTVGP